MNNHNYMELSEMEMKWYSFVNLRHKLTKTKTVDVTQTKTTRLEFRNAYDPGLTKTTPTAQTLYWKSNELGSLQDFTIWTKKCLKQKAQNLAKILQEQRIINPITKSHLAKANWTLLSLRSALAIYERIKWWPHVVRRMRKFHRILSEKITCK